MSTTTIVDDVIPYNHDLIFPLYQFNYELARTKAKILPIPYEFLRDLMFPYTSDLMISGLDMILADKRLYDLIHHTDLDYNRHMITFYYYLYMHENGILLLKFFDVISHLDDNLLTGLYEKVTESNDPTQVLQNFLNDTKCTQYSYYGTELIRNYQLIAIEQPDELGEIHDLFDIEAILEDTVDNIFNIR